MCGLSTTSGSHSEIHARNMSLVLHLKEQRQKQPTAPRWTSKTELKMPSFSKTKGNYLFIGNMFVAFFDFLCFLRLSAFFLLASLLLCLFCFALLCLFCFSAFLLLCFFSSFLLLCFSAVCFSAYFLFLFSCLFAFVFSFWLRCFPSC